MFRAKTVFVLGAGASVEVGLPAGDELLKTIAGLVNFRYDLGRLQKGDYLVDQALRQRAKSEGKAENLHDYVHAGRQINASAVQAITIDNIVEGLEDEKVEFVAKLGIVRAIHQAERKSKFFKPSEGDHLKIGLGAFENTWYGDLTKAICENRKSSELAAFFENISIISFNYDRCSEAYLPRSIAAHYNLPVSEVVEQFEKMLILRPYGMAGKIKGWERGLPTGFGGQGVDDVGYLIEAADTLRTFTEGVQNSETQNGIQSVLTGAERIVFLGSAFHRQNLELLNAKVMSTCEILATAKGVSSRDKQIVKEELSVLFSIQGKHKIDLTEHFCKAFFQEYFRTLTANQSQPSPTMMDVL